ncbi:MAG: L-histidine N(alpha)-methyltransferase [Alphaproteobacteria bacterium]|nr:L-histidine N(alpha)-methyltransferase [Alphaproteobacteria bacterium]
MPANNALPTRHYFASFPEQTFMSDMEALFTKKRSGHALKHIFTGAALNMWEQFTLAEDTHYYPFTCEAGLIAKCAPYFNAVANKLKERGPLTVVELGTGSQHAAQLKTVPFVEAVQPDFYYGVDYSLESAFHAATTVRERIKGVKIGMRNKNFITDDMDIPHAGPRIFIEFGSTLGNAEGFEDAPLPKDVVIQALANCRKHMSEGDYLILGVDQNQDRRSLEAAYGHRLISDFSNAMLRRVHDELPTEGFKPHHFRHVKRWQPQNHLFINGFEAVQDGEFSFGKGEPIRYKKGELFNYCNSYKFPQYFLDHCYAQTGFRLETKHSDKKGRISLQCLVAA